MKRTRFEGIELAVMKDSARILPGVCEGMAEKAGKARWSPGALTSNFQGGRGVL